LSCARLAIAPTPLTRPGTSRRRHRPPVGRRR
jgi:hypothetical protein